MYETMDRIPNYSPHRCVYDTREKREEKIKRKMHSVFEYVFRILKIRICVQNTYFQCTFSIWACSIDHGIFRVKPT